MKYYPILLSKAGEFKALHELAPKVKNEISPVIEVLNGTIAKIEASLRADWAFQANQVLLDFSNYGPITAADISSFNTLFSNLIGASVNAVPVIQNNSPANYITLVHSLVAKHHCNICIRASNASDGLTGLNTKVANQMAAVGVTRTNTILLIDLGYAEDHNYRLLTATASSLLTGVPQRKQWVDIVLASGSFPPDVSHLSASSTAHRQTRYEWNIYNDLLADTTLFGTKYGDYGNKHPIYGGEANFAGSCSVKYTVEDEFVIYRGILLKSREGYRPRPV